MRILSYQPPSAVGNNAELSIQGGGVGHVFEANDPDALNVPSFSRLGFEMQLSPFKRNPIICSNSKYADHHVVRRIELN
jgi:hypothetical protein